jgi:pimeloyl-ACP methyl ester carboxylesterase
VLLLLHGLGGTSSVWDGVTSGLDRAWVAPDLPGHGRAPALDAYAFDGMAREVAARLDPSESYEVLGHSLGGVLGLVLAGGMLRVERVVGLGIKVAWTDEELARATALAERPARSFATREEAVARHLAVAGLRGLVPEDSPAALSGVRESGDGWSLSLDARAFGVGRPDVPGLLAGCRAVPEAGHSAHVEDPAAVRALLGA